MEKTERRYAVNRDFYSLLLFLKKTTKYRSNKRDAAMGTEDCEIIWSGLVFDKILDSQKLRSI